MQECKNLIVLPALVFVASAMAPLAGYAERASNDPPREKMSYLDNGIQYEYEYILILGGLDKIRRFVYENHPQQSAG